MKILIACPVQNREWIIDEYLHHVLQQDYDKKLIDLYFVVNNCTDASLQKLRVFEKQMGPQYNSITIEVFNNTKVQQDARNKLLRRTSTYYWLATLRNKLLDKCVELNCDYLLSCDSDILMRCDTITRLLAHKQHAVSALVYNGYLKDAENAYKYPNILNLNPLTKKYEHIVTARTKAPEKNPIGKLLRVDFTGACILISNELCKASKYDYFYLGEDGAFCRTAISKGYELFCDISLFNMHVMSKNQKR